jgi:hypothetical protein
VDLSDIAQELATHFDNPILIGGIAAIESGYTTEATKDVDIIVLIHDRKVAASVLEDFTVSGQTPRGEKGRGTYRGIHVDVYFAHQSYLGTAAQLDVAKIAQHRGIRLGGWTLLTPPAQFATKIAALLDRAGTAKGVRDATTLFAMIRSGLSPEESHAVFLDCVTGGGQELWDRACTNMVAACSTNSERDEIRVFFQPTP